MYLVTEICDREFIQTIPAATRGEASNFAIAWLEAHCAAIGEPELYAAYASKNPPAAWPPKMSLDSAENAEMGAWCNLNSMHFDAHIAYVPDLSACAMLDVLLAQLCRFAKEQENSACGNKACGDCPVTRSKKMLDAMRGAAEARQAKLLEAARPGNP